MQKIPWLGDAMQFALDHVSAGVLLVDADGRVWRTGRWPAGLARQVWKPYDSPRRVESVGGKGYLKVPLWIEEESRLVSVMAHKLVYTLRVGPIPEGLQINHKDLNKTNNHPDNLEVMTGLENVQHAVKHGAYAARDRRKLLRRVK